MAVVALTEAQKLAAERRVVAEDLLAQARDLEEHLANERNLIAALAAAYAGEREAAERVRRARENLAALVAIRESEAEIAAAQERLDLARRAFEAAIAARSAQQPALADAGPVEAEAQADFDAALRLLDQRRDARVRADAAVAEMRTRVELLSGTNGLSTEAAKRVVERRIADTLRHSARHGMT